MKKRGVLAILLTILLTNFISAANWIDNVMYTIGGFSSIIYFTIFLIIFTFTNKVLSKIFAESRAIAWILSLLISFSSAYGIYTLEFDIESWLYLFGIPQDLLWLIILIIILFLMIMISISKDPYTGRKKLKFSRVFFLIGLAFIGASFTDLVYEKGATAGVGIFFVFAGLWRWRAERKKAREEADPYGVNYRPEKGPGFFRRGIKKGYGNIKNRYNPQNRLDRYRYKQALKQEKRKATIENGRRWGYFAGQVGNRFKRKNKIPQNNFKENVSAPTNNPERNVSTSQTKREQSQKEKQRRKLMRKNTQELKQTDKMLKKRDLSEETKKNLLKRRKTLIIRSNSLKEIGTRIDKYA